ncbi:hypothetical protein ADUPG1_009454, partial [Aduncisulcus paluster]
MAIIFHFVPKPKELQPLNKRDINIFPPRAPRFGVSHDRQRASVFSCKPISSILFSANYISMPDETSQMTELHAYNCLVPFPKHPLLIEPLSLSLCTGDVYYKSRTRFQEFLRTGNPIILSSMVLVFSKPSHIKNLVFEIFRNTLCPHKIKLGVFCLDGPFPDSDCSTKNFVFIVNRSQNFIVDCHLDINLQNVVRIDLEIESSYEQVEPTKCYSCLSRLRLNGMKTPPSRKLFFPLFDEEGNIKTDSSTDEDSSEYSQSNRKALQTSVEHYRSLAHWDIHVKEEEKKCAGLFKFRRSLVPIIDYLEGWVKGERKKLDRFEKSAPLIFHIMTILDHFGAIKPSLKSILGIAPQNNDRSSPSNGSDESLSEEKHTEYPPHKFHSSKSFPSSSHLSYSTISHVPHTYNTTLISPHLVRKVCTLGINSLHTLLSLIQPLVMFSRSVSCDFSLSKALQSLINCVIKRWKHSLILLDHVHDTCVDPDAWDKIHALTGCSVMDSSQQNNVKYYNPFVTLSHKESQVIDRLLGMEKLRKEWVSDIHKLYVSEGLSDEPATSSPVDIKHSSRKYRKGKREKKSKTSSNPSTTTASCPTTARIESSLKAQFRHLFEMFPESDVDASIEVINEEKQNSYRYSLYQHMVLLCGHIERTITLKKTQRRSSSVSSRPNVQHSIVQQSDVEVSSHDSVSSPSSSSTSSSSRSSSEIGVPNLESIFRTFKTVAPEDIFSSVDDSPIDLTIKGLKKATTNILDEYMVSCDEVNSKRRRIRVFTFGEEAEKEWRTPSWKDPWDSPLDDEEEEKDKKKGEEKSEKVVGKETTVKQPKESLPTAQP